MWLLAMLFEVVDWLTGGTKRWKFLLLNRTALAYMTVDHNPDLEPFGIDTGWSASHALPTHVIEREMRDFVRATLHPAQAPDSLEDDKGEGSPPAAILFSPLKVRGLELKNRILKEATYEAGCKEHGTPGASLIAHHREMARGGAALTTVAYASVSLSGRSFGTQLVLTEGSREGLEQLTAAIHAEGGKASIQLTHAGYFADKHLGDGCQQMGASSVFNPAGMNWPRPMTWMDITTVLEQFRSAARLAQETGFDAVQVHCGHGYLLAQFLSPFTNHREDEYGGSLCNRLRFPLAVLSAVRAAVGTRFPIFVKTNVSDGFEGGISTGDAIRAAQAFEAAGVDVIIPSGGWISRNGFFMLRGNVPLFAMAMAQRNSWVKRMALLLFGWAFVPEIPWTEAFFDKEARLMMAHLNGNAKVAAVGGIASTACAERALRKGGFACVAMARALLKEPDLPRKWEEEARARQPASPSACSHCNLCIVGSTMAETPLRCVEREAVVPGW